MKKSNKKVKIGRQKYSSNEFDEVSLPHNRFFQFFDVIKIEWRTLLLIGLILLIFSLPLIIANFLQPIIEASIKNNYQAVNKDELNSMINFIDIIFLATNLISFPILGVGISSISLIIKKMVYGEGFIFRFEFIEGMKKNAKFFIVTSLLVALIYGLVQFNNLYFEANYSFIFQFIRFLTTFLLYFFLLPIIFFMASNFMTYKMKINECISNGYKCTFASFLYTLIFSLFLYAVTFIKFFTNPVISCAILACVILLIGPLFYLAWRLFAVSIFDKYINKNYYQEVYRKGLRPLLEQMDARK